MERETETRIELEPIPAAPYLARRVIASLIDRGPPIKAVDAALLASELVTVAATAAQPITLVVSRAARQIRVEVSGDRLLETDEMTRSLLDRLADRWEQGPPAWFELDLVRRPRPAHLPEDDLWTLARSDPSAREEVFSRHEGLARAIARRFGRGSDQADFDQVAFMALVSAIDRFDPDRGVKFSTFAAKTISGELKKHLRDTAWAIKVPRSLKEAVLAVTRERRRFQQESGQMPSPAQLAAATGLNEEVVVEAMEAGEAFGAMSLDAPSEETSITVGDTLGEDDAAIAEAEQWWTIEPVLETLPEREQHVLYLRFFEDMSQAEIADVIGVSQMQVSRILSGIFEHVRAEVDGG